ncbi:MAG: thiamine phosphate synthase [Planctomycetota bacterium]|jgi:thiamine-phosphate pyrophosphorylase
MDRDRILRIVDANLNRAREALRVLEEIFRLGRDDQALASKVKGLRHALGAYEAKLNLNPGELGSWRDSEGDVGRAAPSNPHASQGELAVANAKRLQEALRVLEEFGRLLGSGAPEVSQARFEAYELERRALPGFDLRRRLVSSLLYVILDGGAGTAAIEETAAAALRGGADVIQLRGFVGSDRECLGAASRIKALCADAGALFIVNDRADVAHGARADGVHLGLEDLPLAEARSLLGAGRLIGLSTHSRADQEGITGADYIGVGTVFPSSLKPEREPMGPETAARLFLESPVPAFPIGGIGPENVAELTDGGVYRAAVSTAVCRAGDPEEAARNLREALARVRPR